MHTDMKPNTKQETQIDEEIYQRVLRCDLLQVFQTHRNPSINPYYIDRADRNRFAAEQLQRTHVKRILNLGGGGARHLQASLSNSEIEVYEVDIQGNCDLRVNLDTLPNLPFGDQSFDVACAFDVLEHLENFHLLNEEMFRVAKDYVLISLPNSAAEVFYDVLRNRPQKHPDLGRGTFSKFYGLPLRPPTDRHRWWIYFQDIIRFYFYFSLKHDASLEFWTPSLNIKKSLFKSIFGAHIYYSFFCPVVWIKISKKK
jgi:SAM-dependent methyltransferase